MENARIHKKYCSVDIIYFLKSIFMAKTYLFVCSKYAKKQENILKKIYKEDRLLQT